jgi:hypothetical protein
MRSQLESAHEEAMRRVSNVQQCRLMYNCLLQDRGEVALSAIAIQAPAWATLPATHTTVASAAAAAAAAAASPSASPPPASVSPPSSSGASSPAEPMPVQSLAQMRAAIAAKEAAFTASLPASGTGWRRMAHQYRVDIQSWASVERQARGFNAKITHRLEQMRAELTLWQQRAAEMTEQEREIGDLYRAAQQAKANDVDASPQKSK